MPNKENTGSIQAKLARGIFYRWSIQQTGYAQYRKFRIYTNQTTVARGILYRWSIQETGYAPYRKYRIYTNQTSKGNLVQMGHSQAGKYKSVKWLRLRGTFDKPFLLFFWFEDMLTYRDKDIEIHIFQATIKWTRKQAKRKDLYYIAEPDLTMPIAKLQPTAVAIARG
jgi:hypothetical protein